MADARRLLVGRIGAAHGIKGSVRIASYTAEPLAIASYGPLQTSRVGLTLTITDASCRRATVIARLRGISDRTGAEALNGVELFVARDQLPAAEDADDFYHADLIGLEARLPDGVVIGKVTAVPNYGAGDLIEVTAPDGASLLYPFTRAVVPEVRVREGHLVIVPPEESDDDDAEDGAEETGGDRRP